MATVELRHVDKVFPNGTHAVKDLTVAVGEGELLALVGPSGCGKSTILRMLAGLEEVTAGEVLIGGRVVNDQPPQKRDVAMVFQNYALYPHKTVRQNLAFPLRMLKRPRQQRRRRVEEVAGLLHLTAWLDRRPKSLSGGQQQRVAMGRAMVRNPAVFLLDEPLCNLDTKLRVEIRGEIAQLQRRMGTTMIYVTHDQVEAMTLGDRVAVLSEGALQQVGTGQELYDRPANVFVAGFIGSPGMNVFHTTLRTTGDGNFTLGFGDRQLSVPQEVVEPYQRAGERLEGPLLAGLRPEALSLAAEADRRNRVRVRVAASEALGHENIVYFESPLRTFGLDVGRHAAEAEEEQPPRMAARLPASEPPPPAGAEITLGVDTRKLVLFDLAGKRLGEPTG